MTAEPTVYVVDDEQAVRASIKFFLETIGLNVKTYGSVQDFFDDYESGKAGCLVVDVCMPNMSGPDLQKELAARKDPIPIIFITGHSDETVSEAALNSGAFAFFHKPLQSEEFVECIRKALNRF
ncbi:MAG: response regulator [Phycisphaerales bacterium]|nr:response regulator [Phycisphaerales bacterium]